MSESDLILLWALLIAILGCQLILVCIAVFNFTREIIQVFRRKKGGSNKT